MENGKAASRIDWSEGRWREMLVQQRKFLWSAETTERYARWMGLRQGMTVVDVGCGLGFLGYTYWPHFGKGGTYIGIDQSEKLIAEAREAARVWATDGAAEFLVGDCYDLPFGDKSTDCVMCQTLLMHLDKPRKALEEMYRVLRPGGLMLCKEPDNLSGILARQYFSAADFSNEDYLLSAKVQLAIHDGRMKLGRGDQSIGSRVPHMIREMGMVDVDVTMKEAVFFLEPPYETEKQRHEFEQLKKMYSDLVDRDFWRTKYREEFLAGGGEPDDYERYCATMDRYFEAALKQMDKREFSSCGGYLTFITKARKPA